MTPSKWGEAQDERAAMCKPCQLKDTCLSAFIPDQPCPMAEAEDEYLGIDV